MPLDVPALRMQFPALQGDSIFFDNPGGTQVPQIVIDRVSAYYKEANANHGGAFSTSQKSDAIIDEARRALADLLNASRPEEIVFGPNMTSLTLALSRSLAHEIQAGDEIIVTRLDHDANISPWMQIAEARGATLHWLDFDIEDCTLLQDQFDKYLNQRTRLVAVGYASNAVGTINPVKSMIAKAKAAGALTFIDAVQYAPHGPIDVQDLECDFLAVSAYKFFGPHIGVLYGKYEHLERLKPYKVRPAPDEPPGKFETGTQNHEGIAGTLGAVEYLAAIGERYGSEAGSYESRFKGRPLLLKRALHAIQSHEVALSQALIETLQAVPGLHIWGQTGIQMLDQRVPTLSFTMENYAPRLIAERLAQAGINAWNGNYYAVAVTERLGLEGSGGMLRVGLVHYNTLEEIERLGQALHNLR
ncbi:MAG: cysteine desulfurase-like protein [Anaerolineales bacterium]|nr:MAG: cysteine desulfurase-like protein [Anaerolineales bacterium]